MNTFKLLFLLSIPLLFTHCEEPQTTLEFDPETTRDRTARAMYYQTFPEDDLQLQAIKNAFLMAQQDSLLVTLPYAESGVFSNDKAFVYSYDLQLRAGEQLIILVEQQQDSSTILIDLFQKTKGDNNVRLLKSSATAAHELRFKVEEYGDYKVTVQPAIDLADPFQLKMYTQPIYAFPVSGHDNEDVKSFWAANRGGGKRSHEGIDIFADKGTPLIAITDGIITSITEEGKGGKQVRLKDDLLDNIIYYAHLDHILVEEGQQLRQGDTLGTVGNTGNADTTEPHLHFGIYKSVAGPIDPYPYVKYSIAPQIEQQNLIRQAAVINSKTTLHQGPSSGLEAVASVSKNDTIFILGKHKSWFHAQTRDGTKGFLKETFIRPL